MPTGTPCSREECIAALQRVADELGRSPTSQEYKQRDVSPAYVTIHRKFGSWPAALEAADLGVPSHAWGREFSKADCLRALQQAADELGHPPTIAEYEERVDSPHHQVVINRWGTWTAAKAEVVPPLPSTPGRDRAFRKADCLDAVQRAADALGHAPTIEEYEQIVDAPHHQVVIRRWGSWSAVKTALEKNWE